MVELTKGPRVLHVGCVNHETPKTAGEMTHWAHGALINAGFSVLGTDIIRDSLQRMANDGLEVAYLDAQSIPPSGEKFDTIFAGELIEHLENPGLFLRGCLPRLKPHGRLVLSTPNVRSPLYALHFLKTGGKTAHPEHCAWYDEPFLRQLLERCGYKIVRFEYLDDFRPEISESRSYKTYIAAWSRIRRFLPKRYRSNMVVWAEPANHG
jgi:SAM-dependent methyltransferase